ncbi:MAG: hypothetical protein IH919_07830 [Deltaproteobacteria bacterium]|nr:hypothetical protein [Deltaproteobacteria bacterium]
MPKTKIRPGEVVKRQLRERSGQSISELYQGYKDEVRTARNAAASEGEFGQRIMSSESFRKYMWFARQLGLVEEVGRGEPVEVGADRKSLYMISTTPDGEVVAEISTPVLLSLTDAGAAAVVPWNNLGKAFRESVTRGPIVALVPAPAPAPDTEQEPVQRDRPPVPTIDFPTTFSTRSLPRLLGHAEALNDLANEFDFPEDEWPELAAATESFAKAASVWRDNASDSLANAEERGTTGDRLEVLEEREGNLSAIVDSLEDQDLQGALDSLEGIE